MKQQREPDLPAWSDAQRWRDATEKPDPDSSEPTRPYSQRNPADDLRPRQLNPRHRRGSNGSRRETRREIAPDPAR
jgi:hypothetical protein